MDQNQEHVSRKEREKQARKEEIFRAACHLFAERGYRNTTLDEIAQAAEFGKGTIYNYFPSKQALFEEVISHWMDRVLQFAEESVGLSGATARQRYAYFARSVISFGKENADLFRTIVKEWPFSDTEGHDSWVEPMKHYREKLATALAKCLEEDIAAGRIAPLRSMRIAETFGSIVSQYCVNLSADLNPTGESITVDEAVYEVITLFFDGITMRTEGAVQ